MAGVGVKPQQQAESHKYMAKGQTDFSFGYKSMWVLAPERDGAHNWEGVGLQTALASLGALRALAARTDAPARADRIHVTGHSRGGHGALMVGLSQPDRCMSVSSLSGWYKREYYGDANPLFVADAQLSHLEPGLRKIYEATISEHDGALLASNLAGVAVLLRVGARAARVAWILSR